MTTDLSMRNLPVVLVVDDDEYVRTTVRQTLRGMRATVVDAASVTEGLRRARETLPTVALLDVGLPDGDGHRLAQSLGELAGESHVGIVMMSAQTADPERLAAAHAERHMEKPFRRSHLHDIVARLLEAAPAPAPAG